MRQLKTGKEWKTRRIINRLPRFYNAADKRTLLFSLINSLATPIEEAEQDLHSLERCHWIDQANGDDLENLGKIYDLKRYKNEDDFSFRNRIKGTINDFEGGGTRDAIEQSVKSYLNLDKPPQLVENPRLVQQHYEKDLLGGAYTWSLTNRSINDKEHVTITLEVLETGEKSIENPTITQREPYGSFKSLRFDGDLIPGDKLIIGSARANGKTAFVVHRETPDKLVDVSSKLQYASKGAKFQDKEFYLYNTATYWQFEEDSYKKYGRFDESLFDQSEYANDIPPVTLKFEWEAGLVCCIELRISKAALDRAGITQKELENRVNAIKAAGITVLISAEKLHEEEREGEKIQ